MQFKDENDVSVKGLRGNESDTVYFLFCVLPGRAAVLQD